MRKYTLMLAALALVGCAAEEEKKVIEKPKAVKTITINNGTNVIKSTLPGKVIAGKEASITFKVAGKLEKLPVKEGSIIKKGAVIAQLDQKDYRFAYEKALASFNQNKAAYNRAIELIKNKYISQADFDRKTRSFEVAKADLNIASTNLEYTTLKAPFDGTIAKVYVDNYQNIQVKEQIVTLQNLDFLDVKVFVPENKIIQLNNIKTLDINVIFGLDPNKHYKAELSELANQADPLTQTYEATVRLPRPANLNVLPGMTATVKSAATPKNTTSTTITVPANALFADSSKNTFVWTINENSRLEKAQVTTSALTGNNVEIIKGLNSGDKVVTAGVNFLREKQLVKAYN